MGATERGLCWLSLAATKSEAEASLREEFPAAELKRDPALSPWWMRRWRAWFRRPLSSRTRKPADPATAFDLRGTAFQLRVWQALRQIPRGETRSYSQLAREIGDPKATRAVARACALNRVALVVPCHRVIGADGSLTGYRWGVERKRMLLEAERAGARRKKLPQVDYLRPRNGPFSGGKGAFWPKNSQKTGEIRGLCLPMS